MRQQQSRFRQNAMRLSRSGAALGLAAGLTLMAAQGPARAGDDDSLYNMTVGKVLESIGLQKAGGDRGINYQERPPLVLPPSHDLPPPEKDDAVIAKNPAWPKDPDVEHRKQEAAIARRGTTSQDIEDWSRPLRPDQMMPNRNAHTPAPHGETSTAPGANGSRLLPSELGYKGGLFKKLFGKDDEENAKFTGEPARTSLTEPPPGYQTPSPDQPYGTGKGPPPKATNYYATHGTDDEHH